MRIPNQILSHYFNTPPIRQANKIDFDVIFMPYFSLLFEHTKKEWGHAQKNT